MKLRTKIQHAVGRPLVLAAFGSVITLPIPMNANTTPVTEVNKALAHEGFDRWARGAGSFFDLLADDMTWTIAGSSSFSKTYVGKKQIIDEVITPINLRLASPIVPKVRALYCDGDTVVALWDGTAEAKDGQPYKNTYAWFMKFKNGRIVEVTAFFETAELADLWKRVVISK